MKARDPIIPFGLFRNKTVAVAVGAGFLAGIAMFGAISFIPLFAQGALGMSATEAGSLLTPLMLSWVSMSVVGGRLMLHIGYRSVTIAGFVILTAGFVLLGTFQRDMPHYRLYLDLVLVGAGLGLTMLTLLIAVQQAVERTQLGIATSLNQFSRAIGGAFGVAIMGAVLTAGLASQLQKAANVPGSIITPEQATVFASNPNVLIAPDARSGLAPEILNVLQEAMSGAIRPVFWVGAVICVLALIVSLFMPKRREPRELHRTDANAGETMLMAEQTTINARNQPSSEFEKW
jgi:predicted MFS family arabinose efflux permease